ncbi:6-hydroxy-D-nicotine oxidase [Patellaria atrata CBS 101060]|uniref:6-hydroxy-D-nicotine oxidase n=1 Tax=Patellaria atrata CBS 101060 TaxID=1346257 RepID=A0A9P4SIU8_9PEZI|nr:6-hydroxy-D-nicotine oxidase [Patellaria atrata CBS 101060]
MLLLPLRSLFLLLSLITSILALPQSQQLESRTPRCRCFPGDVCWPSQTDWNAFNKTVGGRLIATRPLAAPCHSSSFGPYNAAECARIQAAWTDPYTHIDSPSSIMAPFFANQSCDPFTPTSAQCVVGTYVQYAVNAREMADYQKAIQFANDKNIRLVIRNTGHDYLGKSTGAGALGIWTHNLKGVELVNYKANGYTGKAIKVGAGVLNSDLQNFAHSNGLVVVGGNCPSVGPVGGYSQGGGHGPVASKFGLAADQVLEWQVVTGTGKLLTATPSQNSDLYWALSGGGGGTYGVVFTATIKAYPDLRTAASNMTFTNAGVSQDKFYSAVQTYISSLPSIVDAGVFSIWYLTSQSFTLVTNTAPGLTKKKLDDLMAPTFKKLKSSGIPYTYYSADFPSYVDSYNAMNPPTAVANAQLGGRFIPRSVVKKNIGGLMKALRNINDAGALISGLAFNVDKPHPSNSVNPAWRDTLISVVVGTFWSYTDWNLNLQNQDLMTNQLIPQLASLTPNGASYVNEADFQQPNWQQVFYGSNYNKLLSIKKKYDPYSIFYALEAVGSEYWAEGSDKRLCRTS